MTNEEMEIKSRLIFDSIRDNQYIYEIETLFLKKNEDIIASIFNIIADNSEWKKVKLKVIK